MGSEVGTAAADTGKWHKSVYGIDYLRNQPIGGGGIVGPNDVPNFVKVTTDFRMKIIGDHSPAWVLRAAALFSRKWATSSSREIGFTLPLFRSS